MKDMEKLLTRSGKITIAALDHRGSLQAELNPTDPHEVGMAEIKDWKKAMVERYKNMVSGILIDPVYGKEIVDRNMNCGWLMSMEQTGYRGGKKERVTELLSDWNVSKLKQAGAVGAKLLLYFDPENEELAKKQKKLAETVSEECAKEGIIFLLEPLSYKIETSREQEVLNIVKVLRDVKVDIWKFEYPGSSEACRKISEMVDSPWVLLSAGMGYEKYREALKIACVSGAAGMAVGRAVWQEFGDYQGEEREKFLSETAVTRMRELVEIVEEFGTPVL